MADTGPNGADRPGMTMAGPRLATLVLTTALEDARRRGARAAVLQATAQGEHRYARIGFEPVATWQGWSPPTRRGWLSPTRPETTARAAIAWTGPVGGRPDLVPSTAFDLVEVGRRAGLDDRPPASVRQDEA